MAAPVPTPIPALRVLVLEDNPRDADWMLAHLEGGGYRVQSELTDALESFQERLKAADYDVILAVFNLRNLTVLDALEILKRSGKDIPLIVTASSLGDETAVECIKQGAADVVLKDRPARLSIAVQRALEERRMRQERRRAEQDLRESEERFRMLFEGNPLPMWVYDLETLRFIDVNDAAVAHYGYSRQEFVNLRVTDILTAEDGSRLDGKRAPRPPAGEESGPCRHRLQDGRIIVARITSHRVTWNGRESALVVAQDITASARAELALRESEERYRTLFERNLAGVFRTTLDGRILDCNPAMATILGFASPFELRNLSMLDFYESAENRTRFTERLRVDRRLTNFELRLRRKNGNPVWLLVNASLLAGESGGEPVIEGTQIDITERKRSEEELRRVNRALRTLSECNQALVRAEEESGLLNQICQTLVQAGGYRMAWVGFAVHDEGKSVLPVAQAGFEDGYLQTTNITWADTERGQGPTGRGIRTGKTEVARDMLTDPSLAPWREEARKRGYASSITLPLFLHGQVLGALMIYAKEPDAFDSEELQLLTELSNDLAYGIQALRTRAERLRAIEELALGTAILEAQSETTIDGILVVDRAGKIILSNRQFARVWNIPEDVISLQDDNRVLPFALRQVKNPESFLEKIEYLNAHETEESRDEIELRDGRSFDRYSSPLRDSNGKLLGRIWYFRDITEHKRSEAERARLVAAIEQSAEAVVITNPRGDIEYVNPAFSWITGYSREEALGQNPRILKSERQDPLFYQEIWATILGGRTWKGELINRKKDGKLYTEQMAITPVRGPRGEITHFIATKQDVTERKTLEAQLQQAAKMEAVGRLAGGVAHDFNNLLTIINGYSELLLETLGSDHGARIYVSEVRNAGDRAASLTRQLLAFSRRQVLAPQVLSLNSVVANVDSMLRRLIGEDIKLRTALEPSLGRVKADPGQIEQVIMNLAVNARDAMPAGGNLTIETANVDLDESYARSHVTVKPGPHVMLAIADTGVGMSPETMARIFEPFFTTKGLGKGTGLGLATVYGIVKQSGGSIWVYSELGHGTVFKVYLPAVGEDLDTGGVATEAGSASGTETVLVVEDEESVRSLIRLALASGGYKVMETDDADTALAMCTNQREPIHLLLSDVVMPKMSGPGVAAKVTAVRPEIKVLFMSGYTDDAIVHHGVLTAGVPFIQKPFSPAMLRKKIREVLDRK
jgi:PAS domain S-box-containing protein